ncbi:MAG: hypothetical protein ABGY41_13410, partial [Candidatus Poribacteria bacterium]
ADGSDERVLTDGVGSAEQPAWAPDGQTVYFTSTRGRLAGPLRDGLAQTDVWSTSVDGSDLRKLTRGRGGARYPAVSPDGHTVVFQSARTGEFKLFTMTSNGADVRQVMFGTTCDQRPVWSPDGKQIAFESSGDRFSTTVPYDIHVMNADGSGLRNVTQTPWNDHGGAWTPDGSRIVFFPYRDGNDEIYSMNANGTDHRRLTHSAGSDGGPRISPDGAKILFSSNRDGTPVHDEPGRDRAAARVAGHGQLRTGELVAVHRPSFGCDGG